MKGSYIIWDTKTGINDGAYPSLEDAMYRYHRMSSEHPNGEWVVVKLIYGSHLSNEKFHANQPITQE